MATLYASTQETTNANRACRVVLGPCTDGLRDILRYYIPPITFPPVIKVNERKLSRLTADQRALILPRHGYYVGSYGDMDISLLYILLRNITNISPHTKGWGNDLDPHDRSLSANIERIRLVRNRCVHSCDPSMSNTDFNSIWSTIRSTMVDLDLFLMNGNKYEKAVYFLRHESMDTAHDLHYEELRKQVEEDKTTREMVDNLENKIHEHAEKFNRVDDILENLNRSPIPQNVREQYDINIQKWREEDKLYYETHNFLSMMEKVRNQPCVTFVGVPGSGKSVTAHHIALKLQEEGYEVVPIKDIRTIEQYGDPRNPQVFVIDDVVGVFGLQKTKLDVLSEYEQNIRKPYMVKSKTLMTCRWTVFNETLTYKPFLTKEETVINLHSSDNALNDNDKKQILQKHGLNEISPAELTPTSRKFPLLCKLFSKKPKCKVYGPMFFRKPVKCILDELTDMQRHNKLNYATLVLCMLNENCLSKDILKNRKNEHFISMKGETLENCELEIQTNAFELMNALSAMKGTYTNRLDGQYTFIHDSMFEICAYHYGKQFPGQILLYMSSSYIAYYVKPQRDEPGSVNKIEEEECDSESVDGDESNNDNDGEEESYDENNEREESFDLYIRLREDQYPLLAKRLYRDIQNMELYDVFRNQVLKHPQVCQAFIGVLETMTFTEFKFLFLSSQEQVDAIVSKRMNVVDESRGRSEWGEWERQEVLVDERPKRHDKGFTYNVRVISWVIYYGHHRILKYIIQRTDRPDAISELFEISRKVFGNHTEKRLEEQYRLLVLSCYSGDVDTVRVLLPLCQETINGTYVRRTCINEQSPLPIACKGGYVPVVKLLLKAGADVNLQDASGNTPLITACKEGYVMVVKELLEAGAIVDLLGRRGNTPLIAACKGGHASVVEELVKAGADVNLQNSWGDTPLIAACKEGHVNVVEELANAGADINLQDRAGNTAMIAACKGGHVIVVERLVKVGADVNLQNKWGDTPLMTAYSEGHVSVVKELVKEGADVNLQDKYGNTPLVAAVNEKHVSVVEDFFVLKNW
ncbi:uncharacterized protein LOC125655641 [Ostrea edulis]|uniref:uncharacterized protein LOC125655641 n=1 Tax=Ostrea edulis TaxID=37623 RepID=UPI0024AF84B9|nr:uncharacterized protein LOC125655641 [Ostrea edulis]